jgi:hypothetical protein
MLAAYLLHAADAVARVERVYAADEIAFGVRDQCPMLTVERQLFIVFTHISGSIRVGLRFGQSPEVGGQPWGQWPYTLWYACTMGGGGCRVENEVVTHKVRKQLMEQVKGWRMELQVA